MSEKQTMKPDSKRVMQAIMASPWVITREALEQIVLIAERRLDAADFDAPTAALELGEYATVEDGIATISVQGPLFHRANLFTEMSGATSSQLLARDIALAQDDDDVQAIVLAIDSPGGQVDGVSDVVDAIKASDKPVTAYCEGTCASGAYWIASAADKIVLNRSSRVGSVGAVVSVYEGDEGVTEFVSKQSPYKRLDKESEENMASHQQTADDIAQLFIDDVASNRGVSVKKVLSDFGKGGMMVASRAAKVGMADSIGSYSRAVGSARSMVADKLASADSASAAHSNQSEVKSDMSEETTTTINVKVDEERVAGDVAALLRTEGADKEFARVSAISKLSQPGHEALIADCIADRDCSVEDAMAKMTEALKAEAVKAKESAEAASLKTISTASAKPVKVDGKSEWETNAELRDEFLGDEELYKSWSEISNSGRIRYVGGNARGGE